MPKLCLTTKALYEQNIVETHWLDLNDYPTMESFNLAIKELFKDEENPELIIHEQKNLPCVFLDNGSGLHEAFFRYNSLESYEKGIVNAYIKLNLTTNPDEVILQALTFFYGKFHTKYLFLCHLFKEQYQIQSGLEYIDFELFAHDVKVNGYYFQDGYVFCV